MEGSGLGLSGLILARGILQRTPLLLIYEDRVGPRELKLLTVSSPRATVS